MSTVETTPMDVDANFCVGSGGSDIRRQRRRRRRRRRRPSLGCSSETTTDGSSFRFSDTESDDNGTRQFSAAAADGRPEKSSLSKRAKVVRRKKFNCPVNSDSEVIDLESGELELKMQKNLLEEKRVILDCRICQLSSEENLNCDLGRADEEFNRILIDLGCNCKGDLGVAHKNCAETWFKTKGDTICEICGATALNIVSEQAINTSIANNAASSETPLYVIETENFWRGRRLLNVLLACMVLAFVISWLFHFKVLHS